jgi:hypothetical protein
MQRCHGHIVQDLRWAIRRQEYPTHAYLLQ